MGEAYGDGDGRPEGITEQLHYDQPDYEFSDDDQQEHDAEQRKIVNDHGGNDQRAQGDEEKRDEDVSDRKRLGREFVGASRDGGDKCDRGSGKPSLNR